MIIYSNSSEQFRQDVLYNRISDIMNDAFLSNFETYMKNVYRVLLSRGMKGCYVYFTDKHI
jgi:DUF2075 family protein